MKKCKHLILLSLVMLVQALTAFASAPEEMFSEFDNVPGIEVMKMDKDMLQSQAVDTAGGLKDIEAMLVYTSKNDESVEILRTRGMQIIKSSKMEPVINLSESGMVIDAYVLPESDGSGFFKQMVVVLEYSSAVCIINYIGKFERNSAASLFGDF